jgi:hypothetical protein
MNSASSAFLLFRVAADFDNDTALDARKIIGHLAFRLILTPEFGQSS